jgi:hypothetical protein
MVGISLLFALFGGIRLGNALITRELVPSEALPLGIDVLFLILSGSAGNFLWQAGRILERERKHDHSD